MTLNPLKNETTKGRDAALLLSELARLSILAFLDILPKGMADNLPRFATQ